MFSTHFLKEQLLSQPFTMYFVIMTVSDSCRGEGRAGALLEMEIAIINARMILRANIRTRRVFVLFPVSQGNVFFFSNNWS